MISDSIDITGAPARSTASTDTSPSPSRVIRARNRDAPPACSDTPRHENGTRDEPDGAMWAKLVACITASSRPGCIPYSAPSISSGSSISANTSSPRRHAARSP